MTELEQEGNLPIEVKKLPLIIKKEGNKMDLRIVWWLQEPAQMLERLLNMSIVDGKCPDSQEFSSLEDQIVILWGIDKSAKDTGCAVRIVNREGGNSQLHTQLLGAVEDSCECHGNLKATFFSKDCPLKYFLQTILYDHYQVIIVKVGGQCQSFTFTPYPTLKQCTTRKIYVEAVTEADDCDVVFNDPPTNGLPPDIPIPATTIPMTANASSVSVCLVVEDVTQCNQQDAYAKNIVGFQLLVDATVVYGQRFSDKIQLDEKTHLSVAEVSIKQINGHVANDYKQSLILGGICSATALCSCTCCLRVKNEFHVPSERLQKHRNPSVVPAIRDAPKREGANSIINTSKKYAELTGNGKFNLPDDMARQINIGCGSSFHEYLLDVPSVKDNGGILHQSGGWINHFYAAIRAFVRNEEDDTVWMLDARRIFETELIKIMEQFKPHAKGETTRYRQLYNENKVLQQKAKKARVKVQELRTHKYRTMNGSVVEENSNDVAEAETAATQAFQTAITHADDIAKSLFKDCVNHAEDSTFAHMNLLKKGAAEMEIHLGKYLKAKSKKPRGKAENAFNSGLQRLAGGKYMAQHSGFEHTTENGIDTLQHFDKVADAVEKVYPASHLLHEKIK